MKHGMRPGPFHVSPSRNRRGRRRRPRPVRRQVRNRVSSSAKGSKTGRRKVLGIVLGAFVLLLIIGIAGHHGTSTPTGSASSAPTVAPTHTVTSAPGVTTVKAVKKHPIKKRTAQWHHRRGRRRRRTRHRLHQSKPHPRPRPRLLQARLAAIHSVMKAHATSQVNIVVTLTTVHLAWQETAKQLLAKITTAGAGSLPDPRLAQSSG
jgi:hypothetical protein